MSSNSESEAVEEVEVGGEWRIGGKGAAVWREAVVQRCAQKVARSRYECSRTRCRANA